MSTKTKTMPVKISTFHQLNALREGDILQKFPAYGRPESRFDNTRTEDIVTYEIKIINNVNQSLHLAVNENVDVFSWPGDLKRINITTASILVENVWWIS